MLASKMITTFIFLMSCKKEVELLRKSELHAKAKKVITQA